jgi:hypothetical protein
MYGIEVQMVGCMKTLNNQLENNMKKILNILSLLLSGAALVLIYKINFVLGLIVSAPIVLFIIGFVIYILQKEKECERF